MKKYAVRAVFITSCLMAFPVQADTTYQPYYYTNSVNTPSSYAPSADQIIAPTVATRGVDYEDRSARGVVTGGSGLPSYTHSAADDDVPVTHTPTPSNPNPQAEAAAAKDPSRDPKYLALETHPGLDLGLQASSYHYREPDAEVSLVGIKYGVIGEATTPKFWSHYHATADVRAAAGTSNYHGSGYDPDQFEDLFDIRGLVSRDIIYTQYGFTPFVGIAFRHLYSDDRGITDQGAAGYRRENNLYYVPFGLTTRFALAPQARLSTTIEYDQVISGTQTSKLGDTGLGLSDIENHQSSGRGYRLEVMAEWPHWSFGPFASYWNINESETSTACGASNCFTGYEPHNETFEAGLQLKYHIFDF